MYWVRWVCAHASSPTLPNPANTMEEQPDTNQISCECEETANHKPSAFKLTHQLAASCSSAIFMARCDIFRLLYICWLLYTQPEHTYIYNHSVYVHIAGGGRLFFSFEFSIRATITWLYASDAEETHTSWIGIINKLRIANMFYKWVDAMCIYEYNHLCGRAHLCL